MTEFLKLVARHYLDEIYSRNDGRLDPTGLSHYLFVYPNHRSALFMGQYLSELVVEREGSAGRPLMAPRTTTISDIYSYLSDFRLEDQMSLLFRLYHIFNRRYMAAGGEAEPFDKFIFWGQMLLSDFNDIDKYLPSLTPEMHRKMVRTLYTVVTDHKEVDVTFAGLDEHLAEVLADFWRNIRPDQLMRNGETKAEKESFLRTWRVLYDVYSDLHAELAAEGAAYEGMLQRDVIQRLTTDAEASRQALERLGVDKVVFVCLTAITKVDECLLDWLVREGKAEFCWDWADPRLQPQPLRGKQLPTSHAAFFPSQYTRFPNALTAAELQASLVPDAEREVTLVDVPSGVGQADEARRQLLKWVEEGYIQPLAGEPGQRNSRQRSDHTNPLHTAIVLPDENLLFPMLFQIPESFQPCNVTMGYSLKQSPVSALVDCLAALQFDARWRGPEVLLNYKAVLALLSHGYLSRLAEERCRSLMDTIYMQSLYEVPLSSLHDDVIGHFLVVDRDPMAIARSLKQLMEYLLSLDDAEGEDEDDAEAGEGAEQKAPVFAGYEREFIYNYLLCIERLEELLERYPEVCAHAKGYTFYMLLQRLVSGVQIPFSGEPLDGLQVMGVLETRSLDFDNLIILSMNEGVYPAKQQQNTFIPLALREAFGLPSQAHRDSVYAYHFYRMLSRASHVTLIYDSRTEGSSTGEVSRYVLQLQYLCPDIPFFTRSARTQISRQEVRAIAVDRDSTQVREALEQFLQGGKRSLSATSIKDYLSCPLRFYLKVVRGLYQQDDVREGVDGSIFGLIVHRALELIYQLAPGERSREVTSAYLQQLIDEATTPHGDPRTWDRFSTRVGRYVMQAFAEMTNGKAAESYLRIAAEGAMDFVLQALRYDSLSASSYTMLGTEWEQSINYRVTRADGSTFVVRIKGIYDRLDIISRTDASGKVRRVLRIVDYKTESGEGKQRFASPADLLTSKGSKVAFQVMLYSLLLKHASPRQLSEIGIDPRSLPFDSISPHLYFMRDMRNEDFSTALYQQEPYGPKEEIWDIEEVREEFEHAFQQTLCEIFDTETPGLQFRQTVQPATDCKYCQFKELCGLV